MYRSDTPRSTPLVLMNTRLLAIKVHPVRFTHLRVTIRVYYFAFFAESGFEPLTSGL